MTTDMDRADAYISKQLSGGSGKYMSDAIASYNEYLTAAQEMLERSTDRDRSEAILKVAFTAGYVAARIDADAIAEAD